MTAISKTTSLNKIALMKEIYELNEKRKQIEKTVKELKEELRNELGEKTVLEGGGFFCEVQVKNRESLDKKLIIKEMGNDWVKEHSKTTTYEQFEIKKVA